MIEGYNEIFHTRYAQKNLADNGSSLPGHQISNEWESFVFQAVSCITVEMPGL
jgi:hypothetical protein